MSTRNSVPVTLADLEFESDRLVKVRGMRPEYMDGLALIALVRDLASALRSVGDGWRPIATAPVDGTHVIIAVPTKDRDGFHIGEAYFDREHYGLGDWWWAGTSHKDHFSGPVSDINYHAPTNWQPMPADPTPCDHDWFDCSNVAVPPPAKSCRKCGWTCGDDESRGLFMVWPWFQPGLRGSATLSSGTGGGE